MGSKSSVFLFGEAEKGPFCSPIDCSSLAQLYDFLGNAPPETEGLVYAVQTLLYGRNLIYFRVAEEGFSTQDYLQGLSLLKKEKGRPLQAIGLPGVGDPAIIDAASPICRLRGCTLLVTEKDLYDYLTGLY